MARPRPRDFLDRLVGAAAIVFAEKGLKRARMSDVARQMRVAHGTLYNYVESKEALFFLLLTHGTLREPLDLPAELPIRTPSARALQEQLRRQIAAPADLPRLEAALAVEEADDAEAELAGILDELYTRTEHGRHVASAIDRSAIDLSSSIAAHRRRVRSQLIERLGSYIERRAARGQLTPPGDARVAARLLAETVGRFARDEDGTARQTVIAMLVRSLVANDRR
jgi:AcrR family transcriptional regulator